MKRNIGVLALWPSRVASCLVDILRHPAFWGSALAAVAADAIIYGSGYSDRAIGSDGWGYYLHLPAIFIHGDPWLTFLNDPNLPADIARYRLSDGGFQGLSVHGSGFLNKYAFGAAVLQFPFFLGAWLFSALRGGPVNGFEFPFQVANVLSAIFYFSLGSFVLYRAMRLRYDVVPSALALIVLLLTSNLIFYASGDGSFSHVYGYCLLSGTVYLTVRQTQSNDAPSRRSFVAFGALMGLAVAVRPTNAVYALLFPAFAYRTPMPALVTRSAIALAASALAALPQTMLWFVTTGRPIYYSYTGEGFHFLAPELFNYLFSIRKGVFFWHPIYLAMLAALALQLKRRPLEASLMLATVLCGLYVGASWGDYTFGDSFGSRHSIELLPILTLALAGAIAWILPPRPRQLLLTVAVALLTALNLVLLHGYIDGKLPRNNANRVSYMKFWQQTLGISAE